MGRIGGIGRGPGCAKATLRVICKRGKGYQALGLVDDLWEFVGLDVAAVDGHNAGV